MEHKINNAPGQSKIELPQATEALDAAKYRIAEEMGVNIPKKGNAYDWRMVPRYYCGAVGGELVKRMVQFAEQQAARGEEFLHIEAEGKVPHDNEPPTQYEGPTKDIQHQREPTQLQ
jgi:hypothetical protein